MKGPKYEVVVYKNLKVGHKPPRLVPFVTNFPEGGPQHRRSGEDLNPVVAAYRDFSRAVHGANHIALQMRQLGRQMTCSHDVRAFMLRYAAANAFTACKRLGLIDSGMSMWDFEWSILMQRYFASFGVPAVQPSAMHDLVKWSTRQPCAARRPLLTFARHVESTYTSSALWRPTTCSLSWRCGQSMRRWWRPRPLLSPPWAPMGTLWEPPRRLHPQL